MIRRRSLHDADPGAYVLLLAAGGEEEVWRGEGEERRQGRRSRAAIMGGDRGGALTQWPMEPLYGISCDGLGSDARCDLVKLSAQPSRDLGEL